MEVVVQFVVRLSVQIPDGELKTNTETQKGSDQLKGWLTIEEMEDYVKNENGISAAKGS